MANISNFQTGALERIPNLRSLRVSTYPNVRDFNIPTIVAYLDNLRDLWIDAPVAPKVSSSFPTEMPVTTTAQPIIASDLRKEMTGRLPTKLRRVTIGGKGFTQIADNILSVCSSPVPYQIRKKCKFCLICCRAFNRDHCTLRCSTHPYQGCQISCSST